MTIGVWGSGTPRGCSMFRGLVAIRANNDQNFNNDEYGAQRCCLPVTDSCVRLCVMHSFNWVHGKPSRGKNPSLIHPTTGYE
jgi:hypothetical protein